MIFNTSIQKQVRDKPGLVVVTGMGVLTPIGDMSVFARHLHAGKDGIDEVKSFDVGPYKFKTGGEIKEFVPENYFSLRELRRTDRATQMMYFAGDEAIMTAGLDFANVKKHRCGVCIGTTLGGMLSGESYYRALRVRENRTYASLLLDQPLYTATEKLAKRYGFTGPNNVISTACSASAHALGYGFELIRNGRCDLMVVGGVDTLSQLTYAGFGILKAITRDKIRPFDKKRSGLVLGEGAGVLVLENFAHAKERGAFVYGELAGYGKSSDAHHMTAPEKDGAGASLSMRQAMHMAEVECEDIDYINAHGTGTILNDATETLAVKKVFGDRAYEIPISSTKSMIGHSLGASGAIEAIVCLMAMLHNFVPPTINYHTPDPECDLDYVPNVSRNKHVKVALSNSFGFGGNNASLVFKKYEA